MTSTSPRYPIKPKTLTLLELCRSFQDPRHPPVLSSSYPSHSSSQNGRVLTRRVYLHPLTLSAFSKQQPPKNHSAHSLSVYDSEPRHHTHSDTKPRDVQIKNKSAFSGLAVLSSSAPLAARMNPRADFRPPREKPLTNTDDDITSDYGSSIATFSSNTMNFSSATRGTSSSTHINCTRPSCVVNCQKSYLKSNRLEKVDVWYQLDQILKRPFPKDPPATPLNIVSDSNKENDEPQPHPSYNSIQAIKIYKRSAARQSTADHYDDNDNHDDYYICDQF